MTIAEEFAQIEAWLDGQTWGGVDFDGTHFDVEPTPEMQEAMRRREMLEEILHLREPMNYLTGREDYCASPWGVAMAFGHCPCPGVPRECWDHEYFEEMMGDPMGDMMGRNA